MFSLCCLLSQMRFWYFMYGANVNSLTVFVINAVNDNPREVWSKKGAQFDGWVKAEVTFDESSKFKVRLGNLC